ncbi:hypothetical protein GY21_19545 [Cryobacterium roopkundense]|uniref:FAD:protein FMN transferase n=1 Tax=Cryobacterium roopkundense TaxID=1001240 RepID=A0A099J064_9MICO|nr:FAD:protein FMN transferase [Cryobacterium roopkundense]KGJ71824.1 hypothetical protein GY21_19545 [Cryobacterium roopkundense]MBB5639627.1 thiamine biosynthesis lipoprotein [Cryobacterium roopkundense]
MLPSSSPTVITFEAMGTVVSLRLADTVAGERRLREALATAERVFDRWNERFSLYSPSSEISLVASGHIRLTDASDELRSCYALALEWRDRTGGVFTPHRADGVIDLSGVVKALAINQAGAALSSSGLGSWSINAGGDVLVRGLPRADADWVTSIVNPLDRQDVLASVPMRGARSAVATSGSAERGEHIWTPGAEASPFRQVSVFAADIVTADVLATSIVAGGEATLSQSTADYPIDVLAVLRDGQLLATPGLRQVSH